MAVNAATPFALSPPLADNISMMRRNRTTAGRLLALCLLWAASAPPLPAQQPDANPSQGEEVLRVSADLVQTGVSVTDRKGRFVTDLKPADFELLVDGRPQPVSFFERVAGGVKTAAGPAANDARAADAPPAGTSPRGRAVLFFVDDLHLAPDSIERARRMLLRFVDDGLRPNDEAVVTAASNHIGFLQQLTGEKEVLRAAARRLRSRAALARDVERPPMSVYQALAIEQNRPDILDHFVDALLRDQYAGFQRTVPGAARSAAEQQIRGRARRILRQSGYIADFTLGALEGVVRAAAPLPGRKLVVFVSDGFFLDPARSDITDRLRRIADAAARAGVVVDTIQASGLNTSFPDAASDDFVDANGNTGRAPLGEDTAVQSPLVALAADTGGRALLNMNDLDAGLRHALADTEDYYVLAWRPAPELFRDAKFHRVEVRVPGRTDVSVRVHRGFFGGAGPAAAGEQAGASGALDPWQQLAAAIRADQFTSALPTYLTADYLDTPQGGAALALLLQVPAEPGGDAQQPGAVDVAGAIYDARGQTVGSFIDRLAVKPAAGGRALDVVYFDQINVRPGLYQVRAAARDTRTGALGRSTRWVEVPDLKSGRLALSSLLIGARGEGAAAADTPELLPRAQLKVDRRFTHAARLRFLLFVYNAARANNRTQLSARVVLLRADQTTVATLTRAITTDAVGDPARVPYAEELTLATLPRGRYLLRVTVTDAVARTTATREADFEVE